MIGHVTRRGLLSGLGFGLGAWTLGLDLKASPKRTTATVDADFDPNVFIHVAADNTIQLVCHRSEMGQGIRSTWVYLFADEMDAAVDTITLVQADGDEAYGDQNTDGSSSIRRRYVELRRFAATARRALVEAAAQQWRVRPDALTVKDSTVSHGPTRRRATFGELAAAAAKAKLPPAARVKLKAKKDLRYIGKRFPMADAPLFTVGKAQYAADVRLDGMLVAVIARPPVVGAKLTSVDDAAAKKIPGVKQIVRMPTPSAPYAFKPWGGVAVLADNTWAAMRGRAALKLTWSASPNDDYDSKAYKQSMAAAVQKPGDVRRNKGDAEAALEQAASTVERDYYVPHLLHTPMEPPAATARVVDGGLEVWACTQNPQTATTSAAKAAGVKPEDVVVHVTFLGGAFGRKSKGDFVAEAAFLAKATGQPVRVQWTREDDVRHDYFNAVSMQRFTAGLNESGEVTAWRHRTAFPPIASTFSAGADTPSARDLQQGVLDLALAVPHVRAEAVSAKAHARIGWLRSVYNIFHGFGVGSFIDELATEKKQDPRDTWLELIGPAREMSLADLGIEGLSNYGASLKDHPVDAGRLRAVIERVTAEAKWSQKRGRALGLAAHRSFLAYVAAVVSVKKVGGKVAVDEVWVTIDAGTVVNPDRARAQMEGSVIFGMNLALHGGVDFAQGRPVQSNFHDLKLLRIGDAPRKIHVTLVESARPPSGVGEPGVPPVAPALANAYFALEGKRLRDLPFGRAFGI